MMFTCEVRWISCATILSLSISWAQIWNSSLVASCLLVWNYDLDGKHMIYKYKRAYSLNLLCKLRSILPNTTWNKTLTLKRHRSHLRALSRSIMPRPPMAFKGWWRTIPTLFFAIALQSCVEMLILANPKDQQHPTCTIIKHLPL